MNKLVLFLLFVSNGAFASTDITSLINSKGDLVIVFVDKVGTGSYESSLLWSAMVGNESTKQIKNSAFTLTCATSLSEPLKERFGSCRIVLSKEKLAHPNGYYGGIVSDEEVLSKLNDCNISFANGKLLFTVDHSQKALGIKIDENLVK